MEALSILCPRTGYNASTLQIRLLGGSFGLYSGQVSSGQVTQPFKLGTMDTTADYYVSPSGNHQDGFQDNSQQDRQRLNANFGFKIGTHQEVRAYILGAGCRERIPGSMTQEQLEKDNQQANTLGGISPFACGPNQACKYGRYYNLIRAGIAYRNDFAANQFFEIIPYYSYQYVDHPIFQTIVQDNYNVGGEIRYGNTNSIFGHENFFIIGHQPRYGDTNQRRFVNNLGNRGTQTQNLSLETTNFGTYVENQFNVTSDFASHRRGPLGLQHSTRPEPALQSIYGSVNQQPTPTCANSMRLPRRRGSSTEPHRPRKFMETSAADTNHPSIWNSPHP